MTRRLRCKDSATLPRQRRHVPAGRSTRIRCSQEVRASTKRNCTWTSGARAGAYTGGGGSRVVVITSIEARGNRHFTPRRFPSTLQRIVQSSSRRIQGGPRLGRERSHPGNPTLNMNLHVLGMLQSPDQRTIRKPSKGSSLERETWRFRRENLAGRRLKRNKRPSLHSQELRAPDLPAC